MLLLGAPAEIAQVIEDCLDGVTTSKELRGAADVILKFVRSQAELKRSLARLRRAMRPSSGLWIAWPKKASGVKTDMTEDVIRAVTRDSELVDNKVCAIDDTWSGLRLVIRLEHR